MSQNVGEETFNNGTQEQETIDAAAGHGGPGERGGETQRKRHQSMEDLSVQQTTGIELARLLRVRLIAQLFLFPEMQLILFPLNM